VKLLIAVALIAVVVSLGQALFAMASGPQNSGRVLKALTVRISVSVALFIALMVAWRFGLIEPHGLR
jgi:ABC-type nitrate/sulfonate/bicarbonate transport system substrate-binding protein